MLEKKGACGGDTVREDRGKLEARKVIDIHSLENQSAVWIYKSKKLRWKKGRKP